MRHSSSIMLGHAEFLAMKIVVCQLSVNSTVVGAVPPSVLEDVGWGTRDTCIPSP